MNKFGLPEATTPILSSYEYGNGVGIFRWSDGTTERLPGSEAEVLEYFQKIQANGGAKPSASEP